MITFKYKTNGGCAFPVGYKQNLGLHSAKDRGGVKEVAIDTCVYHLMCTTVCTVQSLLDIYIWFVVQCYCLVIVAATPAGSGCCGFILTWTVYKQLTPGFIILTGVDPGVHSSVGVCVNECVVV